MLTDELQNSTMKAGQCMAHQAVVVFEITIARKVLIELSSGITHDGPYSYDIYGTCGNQNQFENDLELDQWRGTCNMTGQEGIVLVEASTDVFAAPECQMSNRKSVNPVIDFGDRLAK